MIKKKLALWLVLILVFNLFAGMAGFADIPEVVLPEESVPPVVSEPNAENPATTGTEVIQASDTAEIPVSPKGIPDISVLSSEAELNAIPLEQTENYFLVRYEDGSLEIRKKSIPMMQALVSEAEPVPSTDELVALYDQKSAVVHAEPIIIFHMAENSTATPQDPIYTNGNLWGFDAVKAQQVFGLVATPSLANVVVAVVDSGVNYNHYDLDDAVYKVGGAMVGKDYIDDDSSPLDMNGHGTHVAGTIAAEANTDDTVGVAAGVKIMPVRVLDAAGNGSSVNVAYGIRWAVDNGAKIINLSLGSKDESAEVTLAVQYAVNAGVLVVAASGNGDPVTQFPGDNFGIDGNEPGINVKPMLYPAALTPVLSVGSIGRVFSGMTFTGKYRLSNFSCAATASGTELDVCAPGENIYSSSLETTGTEVKSGTSMATPHVAAVAALLKAQDPTRSADWIINRIKATTQVGVYDDTIYYDAPLLREKFYGKGLVDCAAALSAFNASIAPVTDMSTLPSAIGTIEIEENVPGAYAQYSGKPFALKLPAGYWWSTVPSISMTGGFAAATATAVANAETLTVTPNYSGATTSSVGVIGLIGAQVNASSPSAVAELWIEASGEPLATTASLKAADFMGNYLSGISMVGGISITPSFNRANLNYSATVPNTATTASFTLTPEYSGASLAVNGSAYPASDLSLAVGNNPVNIGVTGPGGTRTYQVVVNRELPAAPTTVTVDNASTQFVLPANTAGGNYTFNVATSTATLDLGTPVGNAVTVAAPITFAASMNGGTATVTMPAGLTTTASAAGWDGVLNLPEIKTSTSADIGTGTVGRVVDIGLPTNALTFSAPVRILMPGMGGKAVKWYRDGVSTAITTVLTSDTAGALGTSDGYININGNADLVIWTKHFTEFVAYSPAVVNNGGSTSGGGGGGGGGGAGSFTINAANGTELQLQGIYLKFPPQSYRSDYTFKTSIMTFDKPPIKEDQILISDIWYLRKSDAGDLLKPYTIRLGYSPSKVDKKNQLLSLYWLDEKTNTWIQQDKVAVDYDFGNASGNTIKEGYFALIATPLKGGATNAVTNATKVVTPIAPAGLTLTDIQGHWANPSIQKLIALKAISGNPDGTFQPEKQVTRAEFITMLVKALDLKGTADKTFSDLQGHWASGAVSTAVANGIVNGFSDGTVSPDALITREQMAVMIAKALKLSEGTSDKVFTDAEAISPWAQDAVISAMSKGIIGGYVDGTFKPQGMATKAEAVTIIAKGIK